MFGGIADRSSIHNVRECASHKRANSDNFLVFFYIFPDIPSKPYAVRVSAVSAQIDGGLYIDTPTRYADTPTRQHGQTVTA